MLDRIAALIVKINAAHFRRREFHLSLLHIDMQF